MNSPNVVKYKVLYLIGLYNFDTKYVSILVNMEFTLILH